ncbi:2-aminoethylphosphonate--pyruvate transaminase [Hydra vulgaris]|uniref:Alanine--glyoxylate aminotransferase n=1 Tax=Hydra vulgaris TaxID=6087 RepID=A0ABM4CIX5_HYDVU
MALNKLGLFSRNYMVRFSQRITIMTLKSSSSHLQEKRLFTPGPLGVSPKTRNAMLRDLGSRDTEFVDTVKFIRHKVLEVAKISSEDFTMIPLQGSGTFSVEAVIMTIVPKLNGKLLLAVAGAYGKRMAEIAKYSNINTVVLEFAEDEKCDLNTIENVLKHDKNITNVAMVHCETTSGVIHPIHEVAQLVRQYNPHATFFVDAMSSFGAIPIDMKNIDFVVTSANKCIEGVPGFGIVVARKERLLECKGRSRSLSLDLYEQYIGLEKTGQFRFTPPTHCILAFKKAVEIWEAEGGVEGRAQRYKENRLVLREGMAKLGFKEFLSDTHSGYIITSYRYPLDSRFNFNEFYSRLNDKDLVIYPGKVTNADCFRIGNIGNLTANDMRDLLAAIKEVCQDMGIKLPIDS